MLYNIFNIAVLTAVFIVQLFVPMAEGGRTYFAYIVPWLLFIFRGLFVLKIFGIPVRVKIPMTGEAAVYGFTMFFFLSALYKKGFEVNPVGIAANIVCLIIVLALEIVEENIFVYEYREVEEDD